MFEKLKKTVVRAKVRSFLEDKEFGMALGGIKSTGGKVSKYLHDFYNALFSIVVVPFQNMKEEEVNEIADLAADLYGPIVKLIEAYEEGNKAYDEHKDTIKSIAARMEPEIEKFEKVIEEQVPDIEKDTDTIRGMFKDIFNRNI